MIDLITNPNPKIKFVVVVVGFVVVVGSIDLNRFGIKETISIFCEERLCVYVVGCFDRKSVTEYLTLWD